MSDSPTDCTRFEDLLIERAADPAHPIWVAHLSHCAACRAQWHAHQALVAAFASEPVPGLSPAFEHGLRRKATADIEVVPLRGWRLLTLAAYSVAGLAVLRQVLGDIALPAIPVSWMAAAIYAAVPLSFLLAAAVSRLIPSRRPAQGVRLFAL